MNVAREGWQKASRKEVARKTQVFAHFTSKTNTSGDDDHDQIISASHNYIGTLLGSPIRFLTNHFFS